MQRPVVADTVDGVDDNILPGQPVERVLERIERPPPTRPAPLFRVRFS